MSMYEAEHPFGQELESVHGSLLSGMLDSIGSLLPEHVKVNYEDPISGDGVGTLRIADWNTDNISALYFPIASDDPSWKLKNLADDSEVPVKQRVVIKDILGRGFPVTLQDEHVLSSFLRFDVTDEGIVFMCGTAEGGSAPLQARYESELYDTFEGMARVHSGVSAVIELASKY